MERDVHFYSTPGSSKWKLRIDDDTYFMGVGNVLKDKAYFDLLSKKLNFSEGTALEEAMERPQFNVENPLMFEIDQGPMGDRVILLKPHYIERREAIGVVLELLLDRIECTANQE